MVKDDGNGDGLPTPGQPTSFTQYVEKHEFKEFCVIVETALWGADKRNGLVADVNGLKTQLKMGLAVMGFIAGIIGPLITFVLIKYMGG